MTRLTLRSSSVTSVLHKQSSDLDLKLVETAAKNKSDKLVLAQTEQEQRRLQSQLARAKQAA